MYLPLHCIVCWLGANLARKASSRREGLWFPLGPSWAIIFFSLSYGLRLFWFVRRGSWCESSAHVLWSGSSWCERVVLLMAVEHDRWEWAPFLLPRLRPRCRLSFSLTCQPWERHNTVWFKGSKQGRIWIRKIPGLGWWFPSENIRTKLQGCIQRE